MNLDPAQPGIVNPQPPKAGRGGRLWPWFERTCLVSGLLLLLMFAGFRFQQSESGADGVASFYQQAQAAGLAETTVEVPPAPQAAAASTISRPLQGDPPGFELWSDKRIKDYEASLQQVTAVPLAVMRIDRLGIEVPVYNGTDEIILNRGAGRIPGTAQVNAVGNLGIAGHRDGFFRGLKDIQIGDVLKLDTIHGEMTYRVGSTVIVDPSDVSVLAPTSERTITLVTCYPFYFVGHAPKRFIVQATAEPQIAMN